MRFAATLALAATLGASAPAHAGEPAGDTLGVQMKGAGLGLLLGGGVGVLASLGVGGKDKVAAATAGAMVGAIIGIPAGVQKLSDSEGGTGSGFGTLLGAAIGMSAAAASIYGNRNEKTTPDIVIPEILIVVGCVVAGPVIGYRATEDKHGTVMPVMLSGTF